MASARQSRLRRYTKRPGIMPGLEKVWWALRDSNPEPRDYEYGQSPIEVHLDIDVSSQVN